MLSSCLKCNKLNCAFGMCLGAFSIVKEVLETTNVFRKTSFTIQQVF